MLYNSLIFIMLFMPIVLIVWYGLSYLSNKSFAKLFVIGMSFWFYGYYNPSYLWILISSLAFNYFISFLFLKISSKNISKIIFILGLTGNIGLLFYFKYLNFFIDNCNFIFHSDISIEKIVLPLGISFFTFQQISFIADRYMKKANHYNLIDYIFYVSFFAQLVAGPIVKHDHFIPQLYKDDVGTFKADNMLKGLSLFSLGIGKKVLIADTLALLVNAEYDNIPWLDMPTAWCVIIFYMMELYFDFSGYSDMSRGIGLMMGLDIPVNFNSPFKADSVRDFWRRWHITLSDFLTQYIYIPLGGNRKGKLRQCINIFIVFLVSGIWHGANWTFIVWGLMHGMAAIFEAALPNFKFKHKIPRIILTQIYIILSFSIFRAESLKQTLELWKQLFGFKFLNRFIGMCNTLALPENYALIKFLDITKPSMENLVYVATFVIITLIAFLLIKGLRAEEWIEKYGYKRTGIFVIGTIFVWSFISLSHVSVFLYFNF